MLSTHACPVMVAAVSEDRYDNLCLVFHSIQHMGLASWGIVDICRAASCAIFNRPGHTREPMCVVGIPSEL